MGTAAIAARLQIPRARTRAAARAGRLAFDELGGPLVAVCGLAGGAGASTLALALARHAAAASTAPVLLTEADPTCGGLVTLAGHATPHPLDALAQRVAEHAAPDATFLEMERGLRLVAADPRRCPTPEPEAMSSLLREARAAHGLVVVDCATTWTPASPILAAATHTLWSVPATPAGLARAHAVLCSDVMPAAGRSPEVLVAIARAAGPAASVRALRRLAATRCERLVLIPYSEMAARGSQSVDERVARALDGLAPTLRTRP